MRKPVFIFYMLTTSLLGLVVGLNDTFLAPYLINLYVLFTFAESYYVLQSYDFDHGIPYAATIIKLANTLFVSYIPLFSLLIHVATHVYLYSKIRSLPVRQKRLKYDYTVNNLIPGPFLLKIFTSFLNPVLFALSCIAIDLRITHKFKNVSNRSIIYYIMLTDIFVLAVKFTTFTDNAYLCYMIMLIIFEFTPIYFIKKS